MPRTKNGDKSKQWYYRNKDKAKEYDKLRKLERKNWLNEILSKLSCIVCSENHPATLDFHHRDPSEKEGQVGEMTRGYRSKEKILKEIDKCDVLCANCHRKHHHKERESL